MVGHHGVPCLQLWDRKEMEVTIQGSLHSPSRYLPARVPHMGQTMKQHLWHKSTEMMDWKFLRRVSFVMHGKENKELKDKEHKGVPNLPYL